MKTPRILLVSLLGMALMLTACGSFISDVRNEVNDELFGSGYEYDNSDYDYLEDNYANDSAVSSLNRYADLINDAYNEVDYLEYDLFYYTDDIQYYEPLTYEPAFTCLFELYSAELLEESTNSPSYEILESDRQWLISQADLIFENLELVKQGCKNLDRYVSEQNYKDDDFAESAQLVTSLYADIDAYYVLHNEMVDKLELLYEIHENFVVDPSDPISVGIGNMKIDLDLAEAITDLLDEAYLNDNFAEIEQLQAYYDQALASGELNAVNPGITDQYIYDYYEYFYIDYRDEFMPAIKRALRAFADQNVDALSSAYWDATDYFDFMRGDYNTFLDVAGY